MSNATKSNGTVSMTENTKSLTLQVLAGAHRGVSTLAALARWARVQGLEDLTADDLAEEFEWALCDEGANGKARKILALTLTIMPDESVRLGITWSARRNRTQDKLEVGGAFSAIY